jgi:hypothetical protein
VPTATTSSSWAPRRRAAGGLSAPARVEHRASMDAAGHWGDSERMGPNHEQRSRHWAGLAERDDRVRVRRTSRGSSSQRVSATPRLHVMLLRPALLDAACLRADGTTPPQQQQHMQAAESQTAPGTGSADGALTGTDTATPAQGLAARGSARRASSAAPRFREPILGRRTQRQRSLGGCP